MAVLSQKGQRQNEIEAPPELLEKENGGFALTLSNTFRNSPIIMPDPKIFTVKDHIAWSYSNLARVHAALKAGDIEYNKTHYIIRSRLFKGLTTGKMQMRSLYDDEKVKINYPQACWYCGSSDKLSIDHLIPKIMGGPDYSDNLVWACRTCNSSKKDRDMLEWLDSKGRFPSILLLRRYIKIVAKYCEEQDLLDIPLTEALKYSLPFQLQLLPYNFPDLDKLSLWVLPIDQSKS